MNRGSYGILSQIVERGLCRFVERVPSWREAVRLGAEPLINAGYASPGYDRQMIACAERYGPYIDAASKSGTTVLPLKNIMSDREMEQALKGAGLLG